MDESEFGEYTEGMTAQELLDWACKRMMGMQEDADGTSEIEADYAGSEMMKSISNVLRCFLSLPSKMMQKMCLKHS